jgi:putative transposase
MDDSNSDQTVADKSAPTSTKPSRGHRALRAYRVSIPGRTYFITACTHGRKPLLVQSPIPDLVFEQLRRLETEARAIELIASVVMPDHIHALFLLTGDSELPDVMHRIRGATSQLINRQLQRAGAVWQRGYFERRLRRDESLAATLHYMWNNPTPPGEHFRCRKDTWGWFRTCLSETPDYAPWLREQV